MVSIICQALAGGLPIVVKLLAAENKSVRYAAISLMVRRCRLLTRGFPHVDPRLTPG